MAQAIPLVIQAIATGATAYTAYRSGKAVSNAIDSLPSPAPEPPPATTRDIELQGAKRKQYELSQRRLGLRRASIAGETGAIAGVGTKLGGG